MLLIQRCEQFRRELAVPITGFCNKIKLSTSAYYAWRSGRLRLSDATQQRIDSYLTKYNF